MSSLRAHSPKLSCLAALAATGLLASACDVDPIGGGTGGGGGDDGSSVSTASTQQVATSTGTQGQGGADVTTSVTTGVTSSVSTGGGNSVGGGPAASDIAMYGDEIPESGGGGGSSVAVGAGGSDPGFEDDRLYLFLSDTSLACNDPFGVDGDCAQQEFRVVIGLPPEYQVPGTYDLDDPAIISNFSEWGPGEDPGVCQGGGGSFLDGTIRITLIDDVEVRAVLEGTSPANLDGAHAVAFCGGAPPEESSVIGYFPSDLPPPDSGSSVATSGPGGGEEKFVLVFADHDQSCADPYGDLPGPGETHHELVLRLPPDYLTPGVYPLSDPNIDYETYQYEESVAVGSGGNVGMGTLTILAVSAESIELELDGTPHAYANGGGSVPRCTGE